MGQSSAGVITTLGQASAPSGAFTALALGGFQSCGLRADGTVTCWGRNPVWDVGQADAPSGEFTAIAAAGLFTCGVRADGTIACWGREPVIGPPSGVQFTNN